jgi:hypothetical protein
VKEFYGKKIAVNYNQLSGLKLPVSFVWRGKTYRVREIIDSWMDHGFGSLSTRRRWWLRRHRYYYQIATSEGDIFEIYYDRGAKDKDWVLYRKISHSEIKPFTPKVTPFLLLMIVFLKG